ncbi:hypothetical protein [Streptomyces sp. NRRL F-5123]|uniref:hypothetical protein n=1 Tax=Streptomyces sp. NRRL F-5123 TaxID=1463856 RepID=UPI000693960F|nr:hypothetical protein [Streptomyces sp. NRRL F-5123]
MTDPARRALLGGGAEGAFAVGLAVLVLLAFLWPAHRRSGQFGAARPVLLRRGSALAVAACAVGLVLFGAAVVW